MSTGVRTRLARPADLDAVLALYREAGYGGGVAPADTVILAQVNGELAGVVRLCPEHGVTVLRGMQVRAAWQRRGIGRVLLAACADGLDRGPAYCLPYAHLGGFYGLAGFRMARADELPAFLQARLEHYLREGQDVLAMVRGG